MTNPSILVFLKNPVRSAVKTRLARTLGDDLTLELYRRFVRDVVQKAETVGDLILFCHSDGDEMRVEEAIGQRPFQLQQGEDLGARMIHGLRAAFEKGYEKAVLIGTDAPDMPINHLHDAVKALDGNDAVIGPALDGGYVLIGFSRQGFSPDVFQGVCWSTETVLEKTLELMSVNRLSCHTLPLWYDVDTGEDFKALVRRLESGESTAPHTWDFIRRLKMNNHETSHLRHYPRSE